MITFEYTAQNGEDLTVAILSATKYQPATRWMPAEGGEVEFEVFSAGVAYDDNLLTDIDIDRIVEKALLLIEKERDYDY